MVEITNLSLRRAGKTVLDDISLTIPMGQVTAIIGPNGAGKTTLMRAIHGIEKFRQGRIQNPVARRDQAFLFQQPIFLRRSVRRNLSLPLELQKIDRAEIAGRVAEIAETFGFQQHLNNSVHGLSGGERQKLALARAVLARPKMVFLDEPSANLDRPSTEVIEARIGQMAAAGCTVILASHSIAQVRRLAQHVIYMDAGTAAGPFACNAFFDAPLAAAREWLEGRI